MTVSLGKHFALDTNLSAFHEWTHLIYSEKDG